MAEAQAIVIDLNVFLAAILKPEGPTAAKLLRLYTSGAKLYTPDYVREEFQSVISQVAEKKHLDPEDLTSAFQSILNLATQAKIQHYKGYLGEAGNLVNDPKDTPYVALALKLREDHARVFILTYNKKDYKSEELRERGIIVLTPRELQETKI